MTPKITPEMRAAIEAGSGQPIEVEDEQTRRVYLLVDRDRAQARLNGWVVQQLALGEEDIAAGRMIGWEQATVLSKAVKRA